MPTSKMTYIDNILAMSAFQFERKKKNNKNQIFLTFNFELSNIENIKNSTKEFQYRKNCNKVIVLNFRLKK